MNKFDSIRPYCDADLQEVLAKFKHNPELIDIIVTYRFAHWHRLARPFLKILTRWVISHHLSKVKTVREFQLLIEPYMQQMIDTTTSKFTTSGLDGIDLSKPCLFISNHRDIAMDPAFVNWALHTSGKDTVRIAIGDNLLTKDWVSDLMRLNKSFIVNRSAEGKREKLAASKLLSEYIYFSLTEEKQHIWIAQREGRAKDGNDLTNPALISMIALNKPKDQSFSDYIRELRIVPVAISYEYDPCDQTKAMELHQKESSGTYEKQDHEDIMSISRGIVGYKGRVHLNFGQPITQDFDSAKEVAEYLDRAIISGYRCFATNVLAAQKTGLADVETLLAQCTQEELARAQRYFSERTAGMDSQVTNKLLAMYAAVIVNQQNIQRLGGQTSAS
ncbi:1-acyl-sn-glycerol-3-phosphate acyltransferase [Gynuella sunshinyii]|uniref:1-acyl-sn-glycerol-3-phosphate acyltransferase n=1 Tax=Gynuella sunshinyii YC6258 TaxID=1445510 RepID=A0A0C5V790_9GAMM|nr:1-acyl-sn-glycerol-3-phosphate acyltransferase [Gynuella sunshinyii]AJQ95260.1 1-acyl-sn-glycerol-3-phosphate acyltransferase [Gynuella sunshinyii YC6258]